MPRVTKKPQGNGPAGKRLSPPEPSLERTVPTGIPDIDHGKFKTEEVAAPEAKPAVARRPNPRRPQGVRHGA